MRAMSAGGRKQASAYTQVWMSVSMLANASGACNKVSEHACMLACMGWGAAALDEVAGVHLHIVQQGMQPLCLLRLQQVHACVYVPPCLHLYARVRGDCKSTSTARARMISRQGASACLCVRACGYACARAYALILVELTHAPPAHTADRAEETRRGHTTSGGAERVEGDDRLPVPVGPQRPSLRLIWMVRACPTHARPVTIHPVPRAIAQTRACARCRLRYPIERAAEDSRGRSPRARSRTTCTINRGIIMLNGITSLAVAGGQRMTRVRDDSERLAQSRNLVMRARTHHYSRTRWRLACTAAQGEGSPLRVSR
jgi:hypothetical protein